MQIQEIPEAITTAAASMLAPYCPGLDAAKLEAAINFEPDEGKIEKLLTRKEAAIALSISVVSVDRMLRDGDLPRRRIRGNVRIPQSAVSAYIEG